MKDFVFLKTGSVFTTSYDGFRSLYMKIDEDKAVILSKDGRGRAHPFHKNDPVYPKELNSLTTVEIKREVVNWNE